MLYIIVYETYNIAVLDHNNNVNKNNGGKKIVFSKSAGRYLVSYKRNMN